MPTREAEPVIVLGAGIVGLATALTAQAAGHPVTLYTDRPYGATTSAKAAASFKPVEVAYNELAHTMLLASWEEFDRQVHDFPEWQHGVRMHTHWEAFTKPRAYPPYREVVRSFAELEGSGIPGRYPYAWRYRTFFVDITVYLGWLMNRFAEQGGRVVRLAEPLGDLGEVARLPVDVVFNCTGGGARALCDDPLVRPIKGQVLLTGPTPAMDWSISADGFYVYPRRFDTVLGGTTEVDVESETVDEAAVQKLIEGNRRILPHLNAAAVTRRYAGLRPYREGSVRLEAEQVNGTTIVHNYGHGGAGVTLCWGSARMAAGFLS